MNGKWILFVGVAGLVFFFGAPTAEAATVIFDDGAVHDITWTIDDRVEVRDDSLGNRTIVNLLSGADIASLYVYGSSQINVYDGVVSGGYADTNYHIAYLHAYGSSTVIMSGGSISGPDAGLLYAGDNSRVTVSGGYIRDTLLAYDNSIVEVSGGLHNQVSASGSSQLTFSGEAITGGLSAGDNSRVVVSGGLIKTGERGSQTAQSLSASGSSDVTICGGVFESMLQGTGDAVMRFVGNDLSITQAYNPNVNGYLVDVHLMGTLASGDPIDNKLRLRERCSVFFPPVPEPATLSLLAVGGLGLLRRRRR